MAHKSNNGGPATSCVKLLDNRVQYTLIFADFSILRAIATTFYHFSAFSKRDVSHLYN
jgi:hypothetical protein